MLEIEEVQEAEKLCESVSDCRAAGAAAGLLLLLSPSSRNLSGDDSRLRPSLN